MVFDQHNKLNQSFLESSLPPFCSNIGASQEKPLTATSSDTCGFNHKEHYWNTAFKPYSVRPRETNL